MRAVRSAVIGAGLVIGLGLSSTAWATLGNQKSLKEAYPDAKSASCKVCHLNAIGKKGELNTYGEALQQSKAPGDAKTLTSAEILAIDANDADADGATNGDEIKAGTNPGDAPKQ